MKSAFPIPTAPDKGILKARFDPVCVMPCNIQIDAFDRHDVSRCVVAEPLLCRTALHADQDRPVIIIVRHDAVVCLFLPQPVLVVLERNILCPAGEPRKLLAAPRHGVAPVRGGIPHAVINDRLSVVFGQLIAPRGICVCVSVSREPSP